MQTLKKGDEAPTFNLPGTDGERRFSSDALARGPLLVAFFKVSCPTCQYTFPFIERLHQQFAARGAQVWGISQDSAKCSLDFAKEFEIAFPILIDEHPYEVSDAFGIKYVPTLFLIDPQGGIELFTDGFDKKDLLAIQRRLGEYAKVAPPALFLPAEHVPEFKPG
jgi:peroxiredoxin